MLLTGKRGIRPYLQDVVVLRALGDGDLLGDGQRVRKVLIGDVMQLLTVICERRKAESYSRGPLSDYSKKVRTFGNDEGVAPREGVDVQEGIAGESSSTRSFLRRMERNSR